MREARAAQVRVPEARTRDVRLHELRARELDPGEARAARGNATVAKAMTRSSNRLGDDGSALVGRTVADVERDLILDTLQHTLGNRTHAANILGISIRTLRNKLKLYSQEGIPVPMPGEVERSSA